MSAYRLLRIRKIENVLAEKGVIYEGLNQNQYLETFTHIYPTTPRAMTAIYLRAAKNPLTIKVSPDEFLTMINRYKELWENQTCMQLDESVDMGKILNFSGQDIRIEYLSHALSHMLLSFALDSSDPWLTRELLETKYKFSVQERVYLNINNPLETIIVFNLPTDGLDGFIRIFLHFLTKWSKGEFDDRLMQFLNEQIRLNNSLRFSKPPR